MIFCYHIFFLFRFRCPKHNCFHSIPFFDLMFFIPLLIHIHLFLVRTSFLRLDIFYFPSYLFLSKPRFLLVCHIFVLIISTVLHNSFINYVFFLLQNLPQKFRKWNFLRFFLSVWISNILDNIQPKSFAAFSI